MLNALLAAGSITSGVALVAFVAVAILIAYMAKLKNRAKSIENAPPDKKTEVIQLTAQEFGVSLSGLSQDQQFVVVEKIINSRRFYAIIALITAFLVAVVAVVAILFQEQGRRENVGPVSLNPGETRSIGVNLLKSRTIDVSIQNITADWSRDTLKLEQWRANGKGVTPEIWFSVCSGGEPESCRAHGVQRGINGSYRKELVGGSATITFFNFRDNPPVSLTATIDY